MAESRHFLTKEDFSDLFYSSTKNTIRRDIHEMQQSAKVLEGERIILTEKLEEAKTVCDEMLKPLRSKQAEFEDYQRETIEVVQRLSGNITLKRQEEEVLIKALHREFLTHNKYSLKIELYSQELEVFEDRKRRGLALGCHSLRLLFPKNESLIAPRSMGVEEKYSTRDSIVVLQNELNNVKHDLHTQESMNQEITSQIENTYRLCEAQKQDLLHLLGATEADLKEILANAGLLQEEWEKYVSVVEKYTMQLGELKRRNEELKAESSRLSEAVTSFEEDSECYMELSTMKINYP
ncbi:hypothetical protein J6590_056849 [Homalodisca vitripennis]|nr:hypothetical protein J6590_056849 [Homalodisca vitripennis]